MTRESLIADGLLRPSTGALPLVQLPPGTVVFRIDADSRLRAEREARRELARISN